jgi:hypothetical protein
MALTKLFDSVLYPPGDIVVDNSGYVIIDDPSTGMYAYQWTGSTLSLITSYLVPAVSIYGNRSIYYNGTYIFRIVGSNLKAYTFNGSVFAEVGSIAIPYSSSISAMVVQWGGTQIVINSASPYPYGHMMLFTFSGSFTYYGTFTPSPFGLFVPYTPHQMMYGSFTGGTYQVSDAGYLGYASVYPGPTPGSISMFGGGGGTKLFSKRSVKFYTSGSSAFYVNGNVTNRYMDYGGVNLDYDGSYLYLVSNVSGTPKVEKIDITTNPCTVIDSITYTGTYYNACVAGRNDLIFVNESSGPYLSVWGALVYSKMYLVQRTNRHVVKELNVSSLPAIYTGKEFGLYGESGSNSLMMKFPNGIVSTIDGIFVCDTLNKRILKLDDNLTYVAEYSTVNTIGEPYKIMLNSYLYVVGVYNNFTRIQKLDTDFSNLGVSGNLHAIGQRIDNPTAVCRGFGSDFILVTGSMLDICETTESSGFAPFVVRHIVGEESKEYYGMIYHSNENVYVNDGQKILKVNSNYENIGDSNRIAKTIRGLKEDRDGNLLIYNVDRQKIMKYDEDLNFVEDVFIGSGSGIANDAYDIVDFFG